MKTFKSKSSLADFENELENLNHSEMKELVGGDSGYIGIGGGVFCNYPAPIVSSNNSVANYIAYLNSFPSYTPITNTGYSGGGSVTTVSTPKEEPKTQTQTPSQIPPQAPIWHGLAPSYYFLK